MSRKKISTTIYVTPEQSEKLKLLHDRTKVPVAVYIREGIDLVLRHYGHLLPGQLPLDAGPRTEPRQATGTAPTSAQTGLYGRSASSTNATNGDTGDSDEPEPSATPSPNASFGGHSAHASAKK
jgi:hypothetical protein